MILNKIKQSIREHLGRTYKQLHENVLVRGYSYSYSQSGEDMIIRSIFNNRGISKPSYLDIGAFDPFKMSNTAHFYIAGSRGVNIEANPILFEEFKKFRNTDINLNIGVGPENLNSDFYIFNDPTLSTFSKDEAEKLENYGTNNDPQKHKIIKVIPLKISTIQVILNEYCNGIFPDFLSIDVEGLDFQILKSIDFSASIPKVICVEAAEYSPNGTGARRSEMIDFLIEKGYYEYANTNLNAIMVNKSFWFV